ncbi:IS66 family transposase [Pyxidicoccus caerfyrddinensis]|nr:transposase [Pyxidicoccus caerfyrddinensis]
MPLDNNHVERQVRGMAVGRKNHYGSMASGRGTANTYDLPSGDDA